MRDVLADAAVVERVRAGEDAALAAGLGGSDVDAEAPGDALEGRELGRWIERSLDALPQAYRIVFVLRVLEELSTARSEASAATASWSA